MPARRFANTEEVERWGRVEPSSGTQRVLLPLLGWTGVHGPRKLGADRLSTLINGTLHSSTHAHTHNLTELQHLCINSKNHNVCGNYTANVNPFVGYQT